MMSDEDAPAAKTTTAPTKQVMSRFLRTQGSGSSSSSSESGTEEEESDDEDDDAPKKPGRSKFLKSGSEDDDSDEDAEDDDDEAQEHLNPNGAGDGGDPYANMDGAFGNYLESEPRPQTNGQRADEEELLF